MVEKTTSGQITNCMDSLTAEDVYGSILQALQSNTSELKFVVTVGDKQHFTSCHITNLFDILHTVSDKLAEGFNREIGVDLNAD